MKKSLAALAVGAAALVAVPVVAGAQETDEADTTTTTDPGVTDDTTTTPLEDGRLGDGRDGFRGNRGHHGRGGFGNLDDLTDLFGITQDELRTAMENGQSLAEVAADQGVSVDSVVDTLVASMEEHLAEEVTEGDLTQAEADEKLADVEARVTEMVNSVFEIPAERTRQGARGFGAFGDLTDLLGIENADLFAAMRNGSTLGEVAEANGVSIDELRSTMLAGLEERLAQSVTDERITQEQADEFLSGADERIDEIIDGVLPMRGERGSHGGVDESTETTVEEVSLSA